MNPVSGADALSGALAPFVPEQARRGHGVTSAGRVSLSSDPLDHADPHIAADVSAVENLLRCWVRETNTVAPEGDVLWLPLAASGLALLVPVTYWSATGWHRFGRPALVGGPTDAPAVDAPTLAALLSREAAYGAARRAAPPRGGAPLGGTGSGAGPEAGSLPGGPAPWTTRPPGSAEVALPGDGAGEVDRAHRGAAPDDALDPGEEEVYPVEGAQGSAYGGDGAPPGAYDTTGALDSAYGAVDGVADATAALADAFSAEHAAAYGPGEEADGAAYGAAEVAAGGSAELVGRVADSVRRTAAFLAGRRAAPGDPGTSGAFLNGEQSLLFGHPLHPTPKSRDGLSEAEARAYSPELRGSFPLHWLAVRPSVLAADSAWTERGRTVPAERLVTLIAGALPTLPDGMVPLPLHPWQAHEIRHRSAVRALTDAGLVRDLGPAGEPWHPTSSVRTVYRPAGRAMLKLSLGLRITNSRRENLRKELLRGVEVHRLLRSGLAKEWRAACPGKPGFDIVRDPAWLAVDGLDGEPVTGVDVIIRHNPIAIDDDVVCLAGLVSPRPWPGQRALRSRLASLVTRLAARTGRSVGAVSTEWFLRYLHTVVWPLLWLDGAAGVALEAHQQNTLIHLDADGWPVGGRYRDNQGYYFRESRRTELDHRLPGIGAASDTFVSDAVADERFAYYLGVNNVLGLIGAFGAQRLGDEPLLLAAFRRFLREASRQPVASRSSLPARLLEAPTLRCKANLLTRLHGLDELVGPVDTQSVYVTIANPVVTSTP
ncbi:iron transporter [Streptomyces sp. 71268]|uniref:IucA/IucC family protein n=1 Tax=Streptomyces sp. 71268 TaxID=3002640 RepID=UPI0023F99F33|nr:IucA/IucC family protein [Streptomyces sp. 71268]WEV24988.1 iron transporter [Streptomyces sp. 71268]